MREPSRWRQPGPTEWRPYSSTISTIARYVVSIALLYFGVQHFLHPGFVPVVPLALAMPSYIPLHSFWAYAVGAALLATGLALLINWNARMAAIWMALIVFAVVLIVYLPILVASPADSGTAVNYFADTLMVCGDLLLLAASIPKFSVLVRSS